MATVRITWTDSITPDVTHHVLFRDDIKLSDIANGVETYDDVNAVIGQTYKYEIQAVNPAGITTIEVLNVNVTNFDVSVHLGKPRIGNFIVSPTSKNKVLFTSLGDISTLTKDGFVISGKTILSIDPVDNHFIVDPPFNFWDNNTIRLGEITDISDRQSALHNFTLTYLENNIPDPSTYTNTRWVATTGSDANDGLTAANAWATIQKGVQDSPSNCIVNVKAGGYGAESFVFDFNNTNGDIDNHKKIRGYKTTADDINSMYYTYGDGALDATEMPLVDGGNRSTGTFIKILKRNYIIFENLQIQGYQYGIESGGSLPGSPSLHFNRILIKDLGDLNNNTSSNGIDLGDSVNCRIMNSTVINCTGTNIRTIGSYHLIDNCKSYADDDSTGEISMVDYEIAIYSGSNNIVKDCHSEKVGTGDDAGHGINFKGYAVATEHNLAVDCTIKNIKSGMAFRHASVKYNVAKRLTLLDGGDTSGGLMFREECSHNIAENCYINGTDEGVRFYDLISEYGGGQAGGHYNIVRNCIFNGNTDVIIAASSDGNGIVNTNNKFYNNTIYNATYLFNNNNALGQSFDNTNIFTNNIISNVTNLDRGVANTVIYTYNDYWDFWGTNGSAPSGTGNTSVDPKFTEASTGDFSLSSETPVTVYEGGAPLFGVEYDYSGKERGSEVSIGAFEKDSVDVYPDYFVSSEGSDSNSGETEALAWETLVKVQAEDSSFSPGDIIAFKRDDSFNGRVFGVSGGASGNPLTYTSYGSGEKPIINSHYNQTPTWTDQGSNIWNTPTDYGDRVTRNGVELLKAVLIGEIGSNGVEYFHSVANGISLYTTTDPNLDTFAWNNNTYGVTFRSSGSYIDVSNLEIKGGNSYGIYLDGVSNWNITNCKVGDLSGTGIYILGASDNIVIDNVEVDSKYDIDWSNLPTGSGTARGCSDGIEIKAGSNNVEIKNSLIKDWVHTSLQIEPTTIGDRVYDVSVHDNEFSSAVLVKNSGYGRAFGLSGYFEDSEIYNNYFHDIAVQNQLSGSRNHFHHNIIDKVLNSHMKAGENIGVGLILANYNIHIVDNIIENNIILNTEGEGIVIYSINYDVANGDVTGNIIRNNIIYNCGVDISNVGLQLHEDESGQGIYNNLVQNNLIYSSATSDTYRLQFGGTIYDAAGFNAATSDASGNTDGDPLFIDENSKWKLNTGSPAINAGTPALSTIDYYGETMDTTTPDIGVSDNN